MRKNFLATLFTILFIAFAANGWLNPTAAAQPNIVVFITDDHSQFDSSVYGNTQLRTPNLQRLADAGMTFTHAFVASPSCAPSRAALLTGLMPARNGAEVNHSNPAEEIKMLPAYLQELGYEVAAFGKVAHYGQAELYGFDHSASGEWLAKGNIQAAVNFLQQRDSAKPVCLLVGTHEPHVPWPENDGYHANSIDLPETHVDTPETREYRTRYYTAVTEADAKLGTIYDLALQTLGSDTLVIFTSDHGVQWPFGKWNLYDEGIRVPFIAAWPGKIETGSQSDAMVSWIDILPTLVEIAGGTPPDDIDGRSFVAVLRGERSEHRDKIFTTHSGDGNFNVYPNRSVRHRHWKYILNLHPEFQYNTHINLAKSVDGLGYWNSWVAAASNDRDAASIVERYHQRPREELYNLQEDPYEQHNLVAEAQHQERRQQMRDELHSWMLEQRDQQRVYGKPRFIETIEPRP